MNFSNAQDKLIGVLVVFLILVYAVPVAVTGWINGDKPTVTDNFVASGSDDQVFQLTKIPVVAASESVYIAGSATPLTDSPTYYSLVDATGVLTVASPSIDDLDAAKVVYQYQQDWGNLSGFWGFFPILVFIGLVYGLYKLINRLSASGP